MIILAMISKNISNKKFIFSAIINIYEVMMTYIGLSATSERSTMSILSGV